MVFPIALVCVLLAAPSAGVGRRPRPGAAERRVIHHVLWDQAHFWADRLAVTRARDWAFVKAVVDHRTGPGKGKAERVADFLLWKQRGAWKAIATGDSEQWGEYARKMPPPVRRRFVHWKNQGRD